MKDKHVVELLEIQLKHDKTMDRLEKALGVPCDIYEIFPLNLLDIVADLLGVPEDNTLENYNEDTGTYTDGYYCRDWVRDLWSPTYELEAINDPDEYVLNYIICITDTINRRNR